MAKHTVYFSTGEIHEYTSGRRWHKNHVAEHLKYVDEKINIYFRPTEKWRLECEAYLERYEAKYNFFRR